MCGLTPRTAARPTAGNGEAQVDDLRFCTEPPDGIEPATIRSFARGLRQDLDLDSSRPCIELLKPLDYCYWPYLAEVMHWFCKPRPSHRTHHLHLVPTGSPRYLNVLAFRDYLRAHPDARADYEALKRELAHPLPTRP
ncbi:GrpB family protein [Micromonospora chersina]|uniref:GrpB family protein n=1 Tax=Micromonospora chersina TaxID=47854 RepID=UPI0033C94EAF